MTTTDPAWIHDGAVVAVVSDGFGTHPPEFVAIERMTPTKIMLVDGRSYRRGGSYKQFATGGVGTSLADPQAPNVLLRHAQSLLRQIARETDKIVNGAGATIYQLRLEDVRATLNDLADKIDAARKDLDRRAGL
jgi:hypothetical protein